MGLFGIGTFTQVNGISSAVKNFFDADSRHTVNLFGAEYSYTVIIAGVIVAVCVALVILGGLGRIAQVSQIVVPFMAIIYVAFCVLLLGFNYQAIPNAFKLLSWRALSILRR